MKLIHKKIRSQTNLSEQEAWWMLETIMQQSKATLLLLESHKITKKQREIIDSWIEKLNNEQIPLSYLFGKVPFLSLDIQVKPPILIPRPETEEWVAKVIQDLKPYEKQIKKILDIGTGSGCIALALAQNFPNAHITAVDINPKALELAQENAKYNNIENINFVLSDLFKNIADSFDLIVSNPPYINPADKESMSKQVTEWEDNKALFAPNEGLFFAQALTKNAHSFLTQNSSLPYQLVFEFDDGQESKIQSIAQTHYWNCNIHKDVFGKNRTAFCIKKEPPKR